MERIKILGIYDMEHQIYKLEIPTETDATDIMYMFKKRLFSDYLEIVIPVEIRLTHFKTQTVFQYQTYTKYSLPLDYLESTTILSPTDVIFFNELAFVSINHARALTTLKTINTEFFQMIPAFFSLDNILTLTEKIIINQKFQDY